MDGVVEHKVLFRVDIFSCFIKYGGRRVIPRFHILVSDVYQGNEKAG